MFLTLTHTPNWWQLRVGRISHSEDFRSYSERTKLRGYSGVAECVAYNRRFDDKDISNFFIQYSTKNNFDFLTLISASIINIFVPSGGGQWAVQGPIIIEAAAMKGLDIGKSIMALAYGDQLTNMLQPFWALPLLGITKLKATQILPYTLVFMVVGFFIFSISVLLS
jgi:short subunit fatty acids transporter